MRLVAVELRFVILQLVSPLESSAARYAERPVVLVRVAAEDGSEGWGECGALAAPTYSAEYAEAAAAVLADHLVPRLLTGGPLADEDPIEDAMARLGAVRGHHMAKAAVEMALLDVVLRAEGRSLASYLGAQALRVPAGATVSLGTPEAVLAAVDQVVAAGYTRVKCKVAPGQDVAALRAVRRAHPLLAVSADANGSYRLERAEDRRALLRLDELGLRAIEQPLPANDLLGHAEIAEALVTPVLLDESIEDAADLTAALALGACDGVSIKPGRLGGIRAAARAHDACLAAGLHCSIGGLFETGLARGAHIALGALPGFDLPGDLGASDRYYAPDLCAPHVLDHSSLLVPDGPGIGRVPDPDRLAATTRRVATTRPGTGPSEPLTWTAAPGGRGGSA